MGQRAWQVACVGLVALWLGGAAQQPGPVVETEVAQPPTREDVLAELQRRATEPPGRYQIVLSTLAAKYTYLLDTKTGSTWVLMLGDDGAYWWKPISRQ